MSRLRTPSFAAAGLATLALAGCGLGPGPGTGGVSLTVTKNFGGKPLALVKQTKVPGAETVMRMLERHFHVGTKYGGGFVESIDGELGQRQPDGLVLLRQRGPGRPGRGHHRGSQQRPHLV